MADLVDNRLTAVAQTPVRPFSPFPPCLSGRRRHPLLAGATLLRRSPRGPMSVRQGAFLVLLKRRRSSVSDITPYVVVIILIGHIQSTNDN